jgi:hypothetical protein
MCDSDSAESLEQHAAGGRIAGADTGARQLFQLSSRRRIGYVMGHLDRRGKTLDAGDPAI